MLNENKKTFTDLLRNYENQAINPDTDNEYTTAITELATAITHSVLNKCINTSHNSTLLDIKRDITRDNKLLENIKYCQENGYELRYTQDGNIVEDIIDKDLHKAVNKMYNQSLGEGMDLINDAIVSIIDESNKVKERNNGILPANFLEVPYNIKRLKKKVWIKLEDSINGWEEVTTSPIQEVYKAVRRAVQQSKAVQTDAKNGYTYLEDIAKESESGTEEAIYRRLPKYADLGGTVTDFSGKNIAYTSKQQIVEDMDKLLELLNLSKQQAKILQLRLSGYSKKAIATYLGVRPDNIANQIKRIQTKAIEIGLQPFTK